MENDDSTKQGRRKRSSLENEILQKVGNTISTINDSKHVDEVICALHSLALLLFPLDSSLLSGTIHQRFRNQILAAGSSISSESDEWRDAFYQGAGFPLLARFLIYDLASNWLACFPILARKLVYDSFFVNGPSIEVVQAVSPGLGQTQNEDFDLNAVRSNVERILVICLLDKNGVLDMAREFGDPSRSEVHSGERMKPENISRVAQLIASLPDKARANARSPLSSHSFFKQITVQLLAGIDERVHKLSEKSNDLDSSVIDGSVLFVGETFARICRRGSTDILLAEMVPRILSHVRSCSLSTGDSDNFNLVESKSKLHSWTLMMEAIKDPHATERLSEQLLRLLASEHATDGEAYWVLWVLFHRTFKRQASIRSMFIDKFLLWKVFPICCLRWILQFAVLDCPPSSGGLTRSQNTQGLIDMVQCLVGVWSKRDFVQTASIEQQAYVTAGVGLCLEKMSKEELESTKDVMHSILQGVSCRLESPTHLVRKMASSVALVFSTVVDPNNPLYLDESLSREPIDWEFGFTGKDKKGPALAATGKVKDITETSVVSLANEELDNAAFSERVNIKNKKTAELRLVDPDEIVDPATLNCEQASDEEDDDTSENSESDSDSSLQPYDLSDDNVDMKRHFSQLVDIVAALRKTDDPDGVERALDCVEKLVRASPDELPHVSGELVRSLLHVRCSDLTVEGEEETAEEKRHKALVALLVMSPLESLGVLNKQLYSPNVDISQRILILDVMTDAAEELSSAKSLRIKQNLQRNGLVSTISETQPWFLPSSKGPAGASLWKEVSESGTLLNWSYRYERDLPSKPSQIRTGKSRRCSLQSQRAQDNQFEWSKNKFPVYAAAFMLPAMEGFDKKRHGVDLLGRDFIVLGKLIYMLGVCMKCAAMHPEASDLAPALLDMLSSREISNHAEAYVRQSVLFAASCVLLALHPSHVASALVEGNPGICQGLEWVRSWSLRVAESDTDTECSSMAMACLKLHSEMALQASRSIESTDYTFKTKAADTLNGVIKLPTSNLNFRI